VYNVALRDDVRDYVLLRGHSQRAAAKRFGVSHDTVAHVLVESAQPTSRRYVRRQPFTRTRRAPSKSDWCNAKE